MLLLSLGNVVGLEISETPLLHYLGQVSIGWSVSVEKLLVDFVVCSHGISVHEKSSLLLFCSSDRRKLYTHYMQLYNYTPVLIICAFPSCALDSVWTPVFIVCLHVITRLVRVFPLDILFVVGLEHYDEAKIQPWFGIAGCAGIWMLSLWAQASSWMAAFFWVVSYSCSALQQLTSVQTDGLQ